MHFQEPIIAPVNKDEEDSFADLECLISGGTMSSAIGWVIQQGKSVASQEGRMEILAIKEKLRGLYHGRSLHNWSILLFFVQEVTFLSICVKVGTCTY